MCQVVPITNTFEEQSLPPPPPPQSPSMVRK